jgi:uncharacterized phage protein (predicted DNA packaging)
MLEAVKLALRIKTNAFDDDIEDLIAACKMDLNLSGVQSAGKEDDPLIRRAVILYAKANFGENPDSEKYVKSYKDLKIFLSLAGEYRG